MMDDVMTEDVKVKLRERQADLTKLIEAFVRLDRSEEWQVVKERVFDKSLGAIEKQLMSEALATEVRTDKIYKLQGEWAWSKQFSDIPRFVQALKKQLEDIKIKLI